MTPGCGEHDLLQAWATFTPGATPRLLPGDEVLRKPGVSSRYTVCVGSWERFAADPEFGAHDRRLHLGLLPQPFSGRLEQARVVLLLLNPGLHPSDYFGEEHVPAYREALLANLRQEPASADFPHPFLDPRFSWHAGFTYWSRKLAALIDAYQHARGGSRRSALSAFSRAIATLELVPYHSSAFGLPARIVDDLHSTRLARRFVHEILLPRAHRGETLLVVTRQVQRWGLEPGPDVVVSTPAEARAAHLGPGTRAGAAILARLLQP